ncbi:hypothetical protein LNJ05_12400 [Tenacibaculum finnmarkense genomovar ulcerans]|uniref:hypothetical protein n=1 Tax=Tenacibaculum finnmarkense TaxID=2781243 RepID=UPI001E2E472F|nr:hypothetical protein [Tenacibaculum finnmarkense]MCD8433563.1 hypothetical protein [Tenacibaculum finnmarkense genomovar ulcerans]MCD8445567.1 hypothetical protein [Tenacibaculum finnmarkense genomovar ulcerans]MCG8808900.1 hypothetical protein [Tenacibaculum finnmarkense]MCG8819144.1 hypothetical protein [Tenacibaculum finnmarkense]
MWKVTNDRNKPYLLKYKSIIVDFFELIIDISKDEDKIENLEKEGFLEEKFKGKKNLDSRLLNINKSSSNKIKPLIKDIIKLDSTLLEEQFDIYKKQNTEVDKNNYNITQVEHPIVLVKIFKDYFYDKFFGIKWIWSDLVGEEYTRGVFKTNFKDENKLYVCPYCDTDTISNERNAWIEHFLPKSKFPFLSCNPSNLLPSCTSCNVSGSGKGENIKNPILNQYNTQIGDSLEFIFEKGKIKIKTNDNESIENFVELLKLRKRYSEKTVNDSILSLLKINYNNAQKAKDIGEFDEDIFFDFIYDTGKINGYYFAQKNLLKYINEI